jgi:predicted  nucleic acid-binding Zn-ribbon protein
MDEITPLRITITCPKCGSNEMRYDPDLGDESPVTCNACEESLGTLSEARTNATNNALNQIFVDEAKKAFGDAFQGDSDAEFKLE